MTEEQSKIIYNKISEYSRIIISRHIRPDGDAVGSTMGLKEIILASFPGKEVYVINEDSSEYLSFFEKEDSQIDDSLYSSALQFIIDTATVDRISNTKYCLAKEIIKLDHHIDDAPFGDISIVEENRSSACELIVDLALKNKDFMITKEAAEYLFIGIVTDSGRFKFNSTSGETMKCAAALLEKGIDTEYIYSNLYLEELDVLLARQKVFGHVKETENGVAYLYISTSFRNELGMTHEEASALVSLMDSIKKDLIWLAFIENDDGSIRVRLRSRFLGIKELANKYHGGGHDRASGATCSSADEMNSLINDADALLKKYKSEHEGWI